MLDETLRKMRNTQTEIDDRLMRARSMVHQKVKEQQALKRKALIKGKHAVAALLDSKSSQDTDDQKFDIEVHPTPVNSASQTIHPKPQTINRTP
jgi:hypothetical protein